MVDRWRLPDTKELPLLDQLLKNRAYDKQELQKGIQDIPDEALLAGIQDVAERIRTALYKNEALVIFGHDDPDGITSTFILYQFLNSCGYQKHVYFIPNRNLEPHGIQASLIDFVRDGEYKLVVTVDNGISASDGVKKLNEIGAEVLITDHHLVQPDLIPPAVAILNPQLSNSKYPYKALAGVGVALMLIRYLSRMLEHDIPPSSYFWAAVGSLADKVPMTGVNRIIVREAIYSFDKSMDNTIEFLLRNYPRVDSPATVFNFIQNTARLIANGREPGGQHTAIRFMLELSDAKADLFQDLERQKHSWEHELNKVFGFMDKLLDGFVGQAFVYYDDEGVIPYGLLGTAATYVVNNLGIPTIMLKLHNGALVCEGRCGDGFNMVEAFTHCKEHLIQFGGHKRAAGFSMHASEYDLFLDCFNNYLTDNLEETEEIAKPIDAIISLHDLNMDSWQSLELLLPWGMQNPEPVLLLKSVRLSDLQQSFILDNSGIPVRDNRVSNFVINWKSPSMIKVLDYYEV